MKISQKLENACRVLLQLADHHDGEKVTQLDTLAQREDVSSSFLVQILNDLRRAGLIESRRGKAGGYLLAKSPEDITLFDISESLEPGITASSTSENGESGPVVQATWNTATQILNTHLKSITLATLKKNKEPMYFI